MSPRFVTLSNSTVNGINASFSYVCLYFIQICEHFTMILWKEFKSTNLISKIKILRWGFEGHQWLRRLVQIRRPQSVEVTKLLSTKWRKIVWLSLGRHNIVNSMTFVIVAIGWERNLQVQKFVCHWPIKLIKILRVFYGLFNLESVNFIQ